MKKWIFISFIICPLWGQSQDTVFRAKLKGVEVQEFIPSSFLRIDSFTTYQSGDWVFLRCYVTLTDLSNSFGDIIGFKLRGIQGYKAERQVGTTFTGFQVTGPDADGYYTTNLVLRDAAGNLVSTVPILKNKLLGIGFKHFDNTSNALSGFSVAGPNAKGYVYLIAQANGALGEEEIKPPPDKFKGEKRPQFDFYLFDISPNPVKDYARIKFSLREESETEILIIDIRGRIIKKLIKKTLKPGFYQISWGLIDEKGKKVKPGTYFVKYKAKNKTFIKKFLIVSE